uniref:ERCC6L2-like ribbon-helix-helix domain-containing protein n=1 Tax=Knipowitschia caucasica TaxID=637954 RepID=A0AAV2MPU4_KNICA
MGLGKTVQQLHSSVVAVESARRYFEAVQGDDAQKGELFGIKNLFRLQIQGTCLTRQILESLSESSLDSPPDERRAPTSLQRPTPEHPVQFTARSTERTRHTTFIIGETPQSICRQQMQEMATQLQFSSVEQFATEILKSTSNQRVSCLTVIMQNVSNRTPPSAEPYLCSCLVVYFKSHH